MRDLVDKSFLKCGSLATCPKQVWSDNSFGAAAVQPKLCIDKITNTDHYRSLFSECRFSGCQNGRSSKVTILALLCLEGIEGHYSIH